jgi:uncharacterized protein (TIGR02453 family)
VPARGSTYDGGMGAKTDGHFTRETLRFLGELARNNRREWFQENKQRYETTVRDPMLRFITDLAPKLRKLSPHFVADPRPMGGSMFRIYRDTRFAKDKSPYKTEVSAHFWHDQGGESAMPSFYLRIEPGDSLGGGGLWHPDGPSLERVRKAIVAAPAPWKRSTSAQSLGSSCSMSGEVLKRPPKGYDPAHPLIEDLKRKDFIATSSFSDADVCSPRFIDTYVELCRGVLPMIKFLAKAVDLPI